MRKFFNRDLTDELIWREIIDAGSLKNLHQLISLNAEAARALIRHEKRMQLLTLGITEIPPDVAEELARYEGEKLYLNAVKTLSPDSAKAIAKFNGLKLTLNALRTLALPTAGKLSAYRGMVYLDGVERIEIEEHEVLRAETVFSHLEFSKLSLAGLKNPTPTELRALSRFHGELELNGIESLSERDAKTLAQYPGNVLTLRGIKALGSDLRPLLKHYKGFLCLSGVETIDDDLLELASERAEVLTLFGSAVRKQVEGFKQEKALRLHHVREEKRVQAEKEDELLREFELYVEGGMQMSPLPVSESEPDKIEASELEDIELNLNYKISVCRRQAETLLAGGYDRLSENDRNELRRLEEEMDVLKDKIRSALDILVERKELGSVAFDSSGDLAAYLRESGVDDANNDALMNIENIDIFGNSFVEADSDRRIYSA